MSAMTKRRIAPGDLMPMTQYGKMRAELRRDVVDLKKARRVSVGPHATFHFENYQTMWMQVHEMLFIEKGGADQIQGELEAYNPLIPQGEDLSATVMFEIPDPDRRRAVLGKLGGIENTAFLRVDGATVAGEAAEDQDRTSAEGKASSVQFIRFTLTADQIARFRAPDAEVILGFGHPEYAHMTVLTATTRQALAADFA